MFAADGTRRVTRKVVPEVPAEPGLVVEDAGERLLRRGRRRRHPRGDAGGPPRPAAGVPAAARPASCSTAGRYADPAGGRAGPARAGPDRVRVDRGRRRPRPGRPRAAGSGSRACTTPRWSSGSGATTCGSRASWWSPWTAWTTWPPRSRDVRARPAATARRAGRPPGRRAPRRAGSSPAVTRPARAGHRPPVRRRLAGGETGRARHPRPGRWCPGTGLEDRRLPALGGATRRTAAARARRRRASAIWRPRCIGAVEQLIDFVTAGGAG